MIAMGDLKPQGDSLMLPAERPMRVLIDQFKSFGADLIHCHTVAAASQAIPAGNRINVPCVFTSDGRGAYGRRRARRLGERLRAVVVVVVVILVRLVVAAVDVA